MTVLPWSRFASVSSSPSRSAWGGGFGVQADAAGKDAVELAALEKTLLAGPG